MTLTRLVLAWAAVAAWFVIATYGTALLAAWLARPPGQLGTGAAAVRPRHRWRFVEALLLTLFASLWFDSLGRGGWWLLFLLVGALATIPRWLPAQPEQRPVRVLLVGAGSDLARYVVAGAILAWRLG